MFGNDNNQNFNNNFQSNNISGMPGQMNNQNITSNSNPQYDNFNVNQMPVQNNGYYSNQVPNNQMPGTNLFNEGANNQNFGPQIPSYDNMYNTQEEPPKLDPIKPLSSVQVTDVPTLDALGPMNVMPETLPQASETEFNQDPLPPNEYNYNLEQPQTQSFSNEGYNGINLQSNDINTMANPSTQEYQINSQNVQQPEQMSDINNLYNQTNDINNIAQPQTTINNQPIMSQPIESQPQISIQQPNVLEEQSSIGVNQLLNNNDNMHNISSETNNIEISDLKLSENEKEENIMDINSDNSNVDTIETIDIGNEEESDSSSSKLLDNSVEKIKQSINEIKEAGVDISLEEFDFEEIIQLIIKINK